MGLLVAISVPQLMNYYFVWSYVYQLYTGDSLGIMDKSLQWIRSNTKNYRFETDIQLIDRIKSDLDARLYEYYVTETELPFIEAHLF